MALKVKFPPPHLLKIILPRPWCSPKHIPMSGYCRSITMGRGRRCRPSRNSGFVTSRLYLQRNLRGIYTTSWCAWRCPLEFWKHLKKIQILKKKKFYFEKKTMLPPKNFSQFCLFVWPAIANIYTTYIY